MGLIQHGSGPPGLLRYHVGSSLQSGHGFFGALSSLFSRALPFLSRAAKTTAKAASNFSKSSVGQNLKSGLQDTLTNALAEGAVNLVSGKNPVENLGTHLDDARSQIVKAITDTADSRRSKPVNPVKRKKKPKTSVGAKKSRRRQADFDLLEDSDS